MISDLSSDILEKCIVCFLKYNILHLKDNVENKKQIRENKV